MGSLKVANEKNLKDQNKTLIPVEKVLNSSRKFYKQTEKSAEFFLKEISNLVISDFKILKKNKIQGITLPLLKGMIHNDQDFLKDISNTELEKKFNEYDIMGKGYLDKISYSGILSEFMIAKAALSNLNKFFEGKNATNVTVVEKNITKENVEEEKEIKNNEEKFDDYVSVSYNRDDKGKEINKSKKIIRPNAKVEEIKKNKDNKIKKDSNENK